MKFLLRPVRSPQSPGGLERRHPPSRPAIEGFRTLGLVFALMLVASNSAGAADVLIRGAKVHTMTSAGTLDNADVLVRNGRIAAVGNAIAAPAGATVVDAKGRALTPGLFGGLTALG